VQCECCFLFVFVTVRRTCAACLCLKYGQNLFNRCSSVLDEHLHSSQRCTVTPLHSPLRSEPLPLHRPFFVLRKLRALCACRQRPLSVHIGASISGVFQFWECVGLWGWCGVLRRLVCCVCKSQKGPVMMFIGTVRHMGHASRPRTPCMTLGCDKSVGLFFDV
jgi:hypothetical protein